ncbi:MAG: hypothetical protein RLZZ319_83, partial [Actinomycetota bacterium]
LVGAELRIVGAASIPLVDSWEHGVLAVDGDITVNGEPLAKDSLFFLETGRHQLTVGGHGRAILIGGAPFMEKIVMWWNFIGRSTDEIIAMRDAWNLQTYPPFADHIGGWIPAPDMPNVTLQPR